MGRRAIEDPPPVGRAVEAWETLRAGAVRTDGHGRVVVLARPQGSPAALWPYSQVLHAAVLVGEVAGAPGPARELTAGLEAYRNGAAYGARRRRPRRPRYYDDNAWVGLAAAQAVLLGESHAPAQLSRRLLRWTRSGERPPGGVRWREGRAARHACSTGAVGLLALRAGGGPHGSGRTVSSPDLDLARRCRDFLAGPLRTGAGLVADHVDARGRVEPTVWSYNQGLGVGVEVLLHRSGEPDSLARAQALADRAVRHFVEGDRLWRQPPCFVAIFLRMLLLLHSEDGDARWRGVAADYVDQVWARARTGDGGFHGGGIGAYGAQRTLDLAGITQVSALLELPPARLGLLC